MQIEIKKGNIFPNNNGHILALLLMGTHPDGTKIFVKKLMPMPSYYIHQLKI